MVLLALRQEVVIACPLIVASVSFLQRKFPFAQISSHFDPHQCSKGHS